ncbi:unnamed protein product, partial [Rotaria sp. Silwood2]
TNASGISPLLSSLHVAGHRPS